MTLFKPPNLLDPDYDPAVAKAIGVYRRRLHRHLKRTLGTTTSPPQLVEMTTLAEVAAATERLALDERSPERQEALRRAIGF